MPHLGCNESPCREARAGQLRKEKVSSIGVVNRAMGKAYLFDATPDFPAQAHELTGGRVPDGIFLTHAHIGHYTGLMYLGKEGIGAHDVRVFCTARMARYLTENGPWSRLVADRNITLNEVQLDQPVELEAGLTVSAFKVPHRDELSDTVGYRIQGPGATAVFIPDIDSWEKWDRSLRRLADDVDILLVDGTFSGTEQVKGRSFDEIPHPLVPHTRELLRGTHAHLWFIHINHNNPLLNKADDVVKEGMEFGL
ncbi:MAG TPA: MBL fold metallo-hydrolase [Vicinamibacteria bacterium]|jgi:pyrroloquinoline quinone biosynthesis protein B|nr:MBL fold metallo-hydrolase [Vicinamibacteria bacterium]